MRRYVDGIRPRIAPEEVEGKVRSDRDLGIALAVIVGFIILAIAVS